MVVEKFYCDSFECYNKANYQCKKCTLEAHYCSHICQKSHWRQSHKKAHELWDILHLINIIKNETVKQSINTNTNKDQDGKRKRKREKSEEKEEEEEEKEIKKIKILTEVQDIIDLSNHTNILLRLPNEILAIIRLYLGEEKNKLKLLTKEMSILFFNTIKHITVKYKSPWEKVLPIIPKIIPFLESIHIEADDKFNYSFIKQLFPEDSKLKITKLSIRFIDGIIEHDWFLDYLNNNIPINLKKHIETIKIREDYFELTPVEKRIFKKPFKNIYRFKEFTNLTKLVLHGLKAQNFTCDILYNLSFISKQLKDIKLIKIKMTDGCYKQLAQFDQLEYLTLRFKYNPKSEPEHIKANINYLKILKKIKYLSFTNILFNATSKMKFLRTMTELEVLKLKNSSKVFKINELKDNFFESLSNLKNVKKISIKKQGSVDGSFLQYLKSSNQFKVLKIANRWTIYDTGLDFYYEKIPLNLTNMKNIETIEEIDIRSSDLTKFNLIEDMNKTWNNLKILNMPNCFLLSKHIKPINKILPNLIHLNIKCNDINFIKIENIIFKYMPMLEYLNVFQLRHPFRTMIEIKNIFIQLTKLKILYVEIDYDMISNTAELLQWLKKERSSATIIFFERYY